MVRDNAKLGVRVIVNTSGDSALEDLKGQGEGVKSNSLQNSRGWSPEASESGWETGTWTAGPGVTSSGSRAVETCFHSTDRVLSSR